jgi:flagellar motor switch protein FliG
VAVAGVAATKPRLLGSGVSPRNNRHALFASRFRALWPIQAPAVRRDPAAARSKSKYLARQPMSALRKAAVLLISLPQQEAAQLLSKLSLKEVESVSIEIARLTNITPDEQQRVIDEFATINPQAASCSSGGLELARSLLEESLGKHAATLIDNVRHEIEAVPFGFLKNVDSQTLLHFIIDEHPQTIALILCHLAPAKAADVLAALPSDRQLSIIRRIAAMGQINPQITGEVARALESRIAGVINQSFVNAGGVEIAVNVLSVIDPATKRSLLESLAQRSDEFVDEIRRRMVALDDVNQSRAAA